MSTQSFRSKVEVSIGGIPLTLLHKIDDKLWQLEEQATGRIHEYTIDDLNTLYAEEKLVFLKKPSTQAVIHTSYDDRYVISLPPERLNVGKTRRTYAKAVDGLPATKAQMNPVIQRVWEQLGSVGSMPHFSTVCRWRRKLLENDKSIRKLIDQHQCRGNRNRRYPQEVIDIVQDSIDLCFMTLERKTIQDTLDHAELAVKRENKLRPTDVQLPLPTRRLLSTEIGRIPAFDKCAARYGREAAVKMFRNVLSHRTTLMPLERAEIDHTRLDIMVIDDCTGLPMGRPWLTVCIDDFSRCILGVYLSFTAPSYRTVAKCLADAFKPKTDLKSRFPAVVNAWIAYGVMRALVVDNGSEFHSEALENGCLMFGIEIHYSPRKVAWFKGKVERVQGTANRAIAHGFPGTTFSNIFEKGDYDPKKHSIARLSTLQENLRIWIVDIYHQKPHRTLKVSPQDAWRNSIRPEDIRLPEDPHLLEAIVSLSESRVLTHKGIEFECLFYNAPELGHLRRRYGETLEVEVRYNPEDIGSIFVIYQDVPPIRVPALKYEYAKGLSQWQHKLIREYAARELQKYDSTGWLEAKEKIQMNFDSDAAFKKKLTRKNSAERLRQQQAADDVKGSQSPKSAPSALSNIDQPTPAPVQPAAAPTPSVARPIKRFAPIHEDRTQPPISNEKENQNERSSDAD
jgi:putative transposase